MIISGYTHNPYDLIPSLEEKSSFMLWLIYDKEGNEDWARIDYWFTEQFGVKRISEIVTDRQLSRSECEEALIDYLGYSKVEFEQSMTIKYKA